MKKRYIYGIELVECDCGVWRVSDLPCWEHEGRSQMTCEAMAQLNQAVRNLGYQLFKAVGIAR